MTTTNKQWCRHIRWLVDEWITKSIAYGVGRITTKVPSSWKCCPICLTLRPGYCWTPDYKIVKEKSIKQLAKESEQKADEIVKLSKLRFHHDEQI